MSLFVDIQKQLGTFRLQVQFEAADERLALLGASGCGKSVTLRCVAGIMTPDQGRIALNGEVFFDSAAGVNLAPQQRHVGYLFQQYALFPHMTVRQNIAAAIRDRKRRDETVAQMIQRFQLEQTAKLKPSQLSGGQQQRVALARILASEPRTLLLDEPFSALDSYLKYQLELELMETLDQFQGTVLWVSHDRGEVFRSCQRVCVIESGHSNPVQSLSHLLHRPETEAAARLSGCKNYADAIPRGNQVFLPEWNLTLDCGQPVPGKTRRVGIRAHHATLAKQDDSGAFPCTVIREIQDVFDTIVLMRPDGAAPDAPLLRMELNRETWRTIPDKRHVWINIQPKDILLLK